MLKVSYFKTQFLNWQHKMKRMKKMPAPTHLVPLQAEKTMNTGKPQDC